ncbi:MAG: hypothetical protein U5K54_19415 [Cytophagales bacterium]|nr:hypothetical protein [Cytophagales bacterium]
MSLFAVVPLKFVSAIITVVPTGPIVGAKEVMVGGGEAWRIVDERSF